MVIATRVSRMLIGSSCILLAVAAAHAQPKPPSREQCDSILRAARLDSVPAAARAYLLRRDGELLTSRARSLLVGSILSHFAAPKPLLVPVFAPGPVQLRMLRVERLLGDSIGLREPLIYGVYDFSLRRTRTVSTVTVAVPTNAPEFDAKVEEAVLAAETDSTTAAVVRALRVDSLPLELRISTGAEDTRLRVPADTMFMAYFPRLPLVDAKPLTTNPPAIYPEEERDDGEDGEAALRVVIDTAGAPVLATLEVLHATSSAFALAAARALAQDRFSPAHVGACNVPQAIEVPFWFSLKP